jgi:hypothetical protein
LKSLTVLVKEKAAGKTAEADEASLLKAACVQEPRMQRLLRNAEGQLSGESEPRAQRELSTARQTRLY